LPSVTLGKQTDDEATFAECFFSGTPTDTRQNKATLGKIKQNGLPNYGLR